MMYSSLKITESNYLYRYFSARERVWLQPGNTHALRRVFYMFSTVHFIMVVYHNGNEQKFIWGLNRDLVTRSKLICEIGKMNSVHPRFASASDYPVSKRVTDTAIFSIFIAYEDTTKKSDKLLGCCLFLIRLQLVAFSNKKVIKKRQEYLGHLVTAYIQR